MCEIIRAAIYAGHFAQVTKSLNNIPMDLVNYVNCPGTVGSSQICAGTAGSFFQKDTWTILLDG